MTFLLLGLALASDIAWRDLDAAALEDARDGGRLVFLDLEAVWCHWCHVMDATTYTDPRVQKALKKHFVAVKVDQDARPDLSRRYRKWGWPALVVLDPETLEDRAIGAGYHDPDELLALLRAGRTGSAGSQRSVEPGGTALSTEQRAELEARLGAAYDETHAGWGAHHKWVPWRNVEHAVSTGDPEAVWRAQATLDAGRKLVDPVWGGVYQYSTHGDWDHAHFEKLVRFEAEIGRAYALAHQAWGRPEDLASARQILAHLTTWLDDPSGGFHPSQDADLVPGEHSAGYFALDDAGRRALGIPRVDPNLYAADTGLAVTALVALWRASGDDAVLARAVKGGEWLLSERTHDGRVFRGPGSDAYLADAVEAGRGWMALYAATGERHWLDATVRALEPVEAHHRAPDAGYLAGEPRPDTPPPVRDRDENLELARLANLVGHATGDAKHGDMARHALRFVAAPDTLKSTGWHVGGVLLVDAELAAVPVHIVVTGEGPAADALFAETRAVPAYAIVERLAPGEAGANGVEYPDLGEPAAFFCADGRCSAPMSDPTELGDALATR
ncbi:MAG: thioredoxin domain-containing protein [Alphaproteobacteria bacterium]|nr:thioredoxin domain-containing protein [Alphaproteobacteria bacterium]